MERAIGFPVENRALLSAEQMKVTADVKYICQRGRGIKRGGTPLPQRDEIGKRASFLIFRPEDKAL